MSSQESGIIILVKKAYHNTAQSLKNHPALFVPFIIFAVSEVITLAILFLSPRMPLKLVFGPFIRTLWGEQFLHYPANFLLLPKLSFLSRMALAVILSSLLTGAAVAFVYHLYDKKAAKLNECFKAAFKKYISLFLIVLILTAIFYFSAKITSRLLFLGPNIWMGPLLICINFILALFVQSAFAYAIPVLIIENEKLIKSIIKSFCIFKKLFIPTLILLLIPMLIYVPVIVMNYNASFLIAKAFPESVLLVLILGIILNSLIIDPLITISTTFLYLIYKERT